LSGRFSHSHFIGSHSIDQALVLFGLPVSVTGFFHAQRAIDSEVEDSFTIILQYTGSQKDLLVTVKTSVTTPMAQQLKLLVRGTAGSFMKFQQRSTCPQEEDIGAGKSPLDSMFGVEEEGLHGLLTTYEEFDNTVQRLDPQTKMYVGRYPTITGRWLGLYENLAEAIQGKAELSVRASESRDVLRVIELARKSHDQGVTVAWT
jgi:predicted dehydrogenase